MKTVLGLIWLTAVTADFQGDLTTNHHDVRKAFVMSWTTGLEKFKNLFIILFPGLVLFISKLYNQW